MRKLACVCMVTGASALSSCATLVSGGSPVVLHTAQARMFSPAVFDRVAVYVEDRSGQMRPDGGAIREVEDQFIAALLARGYTLPARSDMEQVEAEARLGREGITEKSAITIAHRLNARAILVVSVDDAGLAAGVNPLLARLGQPQTPTYAVHAALTARLIDAELAQVVWMSSLDGRVHIQTPDQSQGVASMSAIARALTSALPARTAAPPPAVDDPLRPGATPQTLVTSPRFRAARTQRIAVYVQDRTGFFYAGGAVRRVEDRFMQAALERGYVLAARSDLGDVLQEQREQQAGRAEEILARRSRALGADAIIVVSIDAASVSPHATVLGTTEYRLGVSLGARLLTTLNAEVLWTAAYSASIPVNAPDDAGGALEAAADVVARSVPARP